MNTRMLRSLCVPALSLFSLAPIACTTAVDSPEDADGFVGDNFMSFEEFKAQLPRDPESGAYVVEGDILVYSDEALEPYYDAEEQPGALIVNQVNGVDDKWGATQAMNLTYCVSTTFGANHATVVQAMASAGSAWANVAAVEFVYVPAQDAACTSSNNNVVFNVRPVSAAFNAAAFFPSYARAYREVQIDWDKSTNASPKTLTGILRHELGHTLGFRHEHIRSGGSGCPTEDSSWRALTDYDSSSAMHYPPYAWSNCNGTNWGDYILTQKDKDGAVSLYGASEIDDVDGIWRSAGGRSTTHAGNPRFRLHLDAADMIEINLESSVDTYVYLLDTAGNVLNSDDDSGDGLNSRLSHSLAAGDYIVVAATYSGGESGDFQLSSSNGDLSALAQATWSGSGGANPSSTSNPRFVLNLRYNADVELNLTSSIDTYLYLLDSTGNAIASDDDSGPGLNSLIARSLNAGQYVVVAATYTAGQSGPFDLTSTHGTILSAPSSFSKVTGDGAGYCPSGQFHASRADVSSKRALAESQLNTWDIARLTEGWALRGPGYGYDFKYEVVVLGHTLCATP